MKIKKYHLKNFPEERVRILLKSNKKFLDESINYFGSLKKLSDFLSVSPQLIYYWEKLNLFVPLKYVKKIVNERNLDWYKIEKNVIAYKGPNSSLLVQNPKLPISESPELFAIITHLIGDGSVNKNNIPIYTNSNAELISNFQRLVSCVFGDVGGKIYKRKSGCYEFRSSRIIADLIKSFYKINFDTYNATIPKRVAYLPKKFSISVIKAFADDEGSVDLNHRINLYSRNKKLLLFIRKLLIEKLMFRDISSVLQKSKLDFYLTIKPKDIEKYFKIVGFNHPLKSTRLSKIIEIRNKSSGVRRKDNQTKNEILNLLSYKNLSTEELILKLGIRKSNVNIPLKELNNDGMITKFNKHGQIIKWTKMEG